MEYSQKGEKLTEQFEGCKCLAYRDAGGKLTVGYGHTAGVYAGMVCTQAQADAWLLLDIAWAVHVINSLVCVPLTQGEFDSLVDFTFNVGEGTFARSELLALLNAGQYHAAAEQLERYDHAAGQVLAGLLRRRKAEEVEFLEGGY